MVVAHAFVRYERNLWFQLRSCARSVCEPASVRQETADKLAWSVSHPTRAHAISFELRHCVRSISDLPQLPERWHSAPAHVLCIRYRTVSCRQIWKPCLVFVSPIWQLGRAKPHHCPVAFRLFTCSAPAIISGDQMAVPHRIVHGTNPSDCKCVTQNKKEPFVYRLDWSRFGAYYLFVYTMQEHFSFG